MGEAEIVLVPDPGRRWNRAVLAGTLALLLFAILAFGATEPWSVFVLRAGAAFLLLVWALGRLFAADAKIVLSPLFAPAAAFLAVVAVQWAGLSVYRYATMVEAMNYIAYGGLLFLAVQCLRSEDDARLVVAVFAIFGALIAMEAIVQGLSGTTRLLFVRTPRIASMVYGPYVNHNHYAGMMEMMAPFVIVLALSDRLQGPQRMVAAFAALLAAGSIILSRSRGGMLAFLLEAAFLAALVLPGSSDKRTRPTLALASLVLAAFLFWLGGGALLERAGSIGDVSGSQVRIDVARDSLRMFAAHPVLGFGLGTFPVAYPEYRSFWSTTFMNQAHNDYAQWLVETGAVGAALALWYLVVLFRRGLERAGERPLHSWSALLTLAALTGVAGLLVHSFFDFNLHIPANAALFFFLGGIAIAPIRVDGKQRRRRESSVVVH
jgi:O-antigen ligase